MSGFTEVAELLVSELATNAVRASEQPSQSISGQDGHPPVIGVHLHANVTRLRIEIRDQAAGFPVLCETPADSECGRGLTLVDSMTAGRWGWHPAACGRVTKYVWAEIDQPTPEDPLN
jgi:anti-sigma regulatory factor (Ser/Thr protein kinase)